MCNEGVCIWYEVECMSKWGVRSGFLLGGGGGGGGGGQGGPLGFGLPPFRYAENCILYVALMTQ